MCWQRVAGRLKALAAQKQVQVRVVGTRAVMADNTLFTTGVKVSDAVAVMGDIHHIFPKNHLKKELDAPQRLYNQVANYTLLEKKINIAVRDDAPSEYFTKELEAVRVGEGYYGNIRCEDDFFANLEANCIPRKAVDMLAVDYEDFLAERRKLMANKIKGYFKSL